MPQEYENHRIHQGDSVRLGETHVGKGVFTERSFPAGAVIGEITGDVVTDRAHGSSYSFEIDERTQLEPYAPFRYLNHSCQPNCEFDWFDDDGEYRAGARLYVIALGDILPGAELTIDYNWPARSAIPCRCLAESCRGWIVGLDEMEELTEPCDAPFIGD